MVLGQRTSRKALPCEDDEPNIVVGAAGDEAHRYLLGCLYSVGLEVHRQHTRGDVHREHDVDPLDTIFGPARGALWSSKCNDDESYGQKP